MKIEKKTSPNSRRGEFVITPESSEERAEFFRTHSGATLNECYNRKVKVYWMKDTNRPYVKNIEQRNWKNK